MPSFFGHDAEGSKGEKVFVHTDKNSYLAGETVWFKLYTVDADNHEATPLSRVAYFEIYNSAARPVWQARVELQEGRGWGSYTLPPSLASGTYVLRAYTNFMKNFDDHYFFQKHLRVINTTKQPNWQSLATRDTVHIGFFPEGGNLVQGLESKVGFQLTNQYGKGIEGRGYILTENNDTAAVFQTFRFGLGSFIFTPRQNLVYRAMIIPEVGQPFIAALPRIFTAGTVMRLQEGADDKITVRINSTGKNENGVFYLLAHTRNKIKLAQRNLANGSTAEWVVDKNRLGEGISNFVVFDANRRPLCERLYFKKPTDSLSIEVESGTGIFEKRDPVDLALSVRERDDSLPANLSLSVSLIDSIQPMDKASISSYLWLGADLNGVIESPDYYFTETGGEELRNATENLMLTHGWRRFRWEDSSLTQKPSFHYLPEYEGMLVPVRVMNKTTQSPAAGILCYASVPGQVFQGSNAVTNKEGKAQFLLKNMYGPSELVLQVDSVSPAYRIELMTSYWDKTGSLVFPPFQLSAASRQQLADHHFNAQLAGAFQTAASRQYIPPQVDSVSFYGRPDKSFILDEYTRFPTMEEVMREFVTDVRVRKEKDRFNYDVLNVPYKSYFQQNPLVLFDGVPVFDINKVIAFDPLKVKKIDVVARKYFWGNVVTNGIVNYSTYDGDLGGFELDPAAIILEFDGLQLKKEFYQPEYDTPGKKNSRMPDPRNVLYWNPDINVRSKTTVRFFTSDIPGRYLITVQGITQNGKPGSAIKFITVKN
jgi:hypothetical protein